MNKCKKPLHRIYCFTQSEIMQSKTSLCTGFIAKEPRTPILHSMRITYGAFTFLKSTTLSQDYCESQKCKNEKNKQTKKLDRLTSQLISPMHKHWRVVPINHSISRIQLHSLGKTDNEPPQHLHTKKQEKI